MSKRTGKLMVGIRLPLLAALLQLVQTDLSATECEIKLYADRRQINPFEPVGLVLKIENKGPSAQEKTESRWSSFRIARVHDGEKTKWRTYSPFGPHATLTPPFALKLQPGEIHTDFCLLHVGFDGRHVFSEPGTFLVQAGTPFGNSNVAEIEVVEPDAMAPAVEFIGESRLFMLFDYYSAKSMLATPESVAHFSNSLRKLQRMQTASSYKAWFGVCECILSEIGNEQSPTKGARRRQRDGFMQTARDLPSPQQESLVLAIACAQLEANDMHDAQATFSWLAANAKDGYFRCLAKHQLNILAETPAAGINRASPASSRPH